MDSSIIQNEKQQLLTEFNKLLEQRSQALLTERRRFRRLFSETKDPERQTHILSLIKESMAKYSACAQLVVEISDLQRND